MFVQILFISFSAFKVLLGNHFHILKKLVSKEDLTIANTKQNPKHKTWFIVTVEAFNGFLYRVIFSEVFIFCAFLFRIYFFIFFHLNLFNYIFFGSHFYYI